VLTGFEGWDGVKLTVRSLPGDRVRGQVDEAMSVNEGGIHDQNLPARLRIPSRRPKERNREKVIDPMRDILKPPKSGGLYGVVNIWFTGAEQGQEPGGTGEPPPRECGAEGAETPWLRRG
jgi:hypothetical protein